MRQNLFELLLPPRTNHHVQGSVDGTQKGAFALISTKHKTRRARCPIFHAAASALKARSHCVTGAK